MRESMDPWVSVVERHRQLSFVRWAARDRVEHDDTLLTIAEIAIALAGFASLISVIGRRSSDIAHVTGALRLRLMLEVSFRNAAFALLPLPFVEVAPSDPMLWRILSGLYLVVTTVHVAIRLRTGDAHAERLLAFPSLILFGITVLASVANVLGLGGAYAFSLYLTNILLGLGSAGVMFLSVAATVFDVDRS